MKALISAAVRDFCSGTSKHLRCLQFQLVKCQGSSGTGGVGNRKAKYERRKTEGLFEERKEETDILGEVRIFRFDPGIRQVEKLEVIPRP